MFAPSEKQVQNNRRPSFQPQLVNMTEQKTTLISKVRDGEQAIVLTLLARNENGESLLDSQLELALNMAKNVIQMTGADVSASGSIISFDQASVESGASCRITATIELSEPSSN